jgi:hypothetical protein
MENDNGDVDDDDVEQDKFCIEDDLGTIYLGSILEHKRARKFDPGKEECC